MADIWIGLLFVTAAFLGIAAITWRWTRFASPIARTSTGAVSVLLGCGYVWFFRNDVRLAEVLPFSNLIVVSNGVAYFTAILLGLVASDANLSQIRRVFAEGTLTIAAGYATVMTVFGHAPACQDKWKDDVCIQTTNNTCAAACAATLLKSAGITASETEMSSLCFADNGTTWAGLYRGLSLKTAETDYTVQTFVGDLDKLRQLHCEERPVVLTVGLSRDSAKRVPGDLAQQLADRGWFVGHTHAVLFYGFTDQGQARIGDPSVGREDWNLRELKALWHGSGQMLVRRQ